MIEQAKTSSFSIADAQQRFMTKVYGWMTLGLVVTAITALAIAMTPVLIETILRSRFLLIGLMIAEIGLVVYLSAKIRTMSTMTANLMFLAFAMLNGITFSLIFVAYTGASIASTFLVTAGTFGTMSLWGYVTKRDLTGMGHFMITGLIGMIIASLVNIFLKSTMIYWITTYIGVIVFVGLTAYDTQKIKRSYAANISSPVDAQRFAVMGALTLYLDFINLFLFILRLLGRKR